MTGRKARAAARLVPARPALVAAARRVLWSLVRRCAGALPGARSMLRRRLGAFLRRSDGRGLAAILRSAALAGAVAAALVAPGSVRAQGVELPATELIDIAHGVGGFVARGEAEPASGVGVSVSGAGDVNGDGIPDVIVGGRFCSYYGGCTSAPAYVVFGKPDGAAVDVTDVLAGRGGFAIRGAAEGDRSGDRVSGAGDVNGDGLADLLVGARFADPGGREDAGESYVVFGKSDGAVVELSDVRAGRGGFAIRGSAAGDRAGESLSGAGDVNGDGLADLLIGAQFADPGGREDAGESYVVFGKPDGAVVELSDVQAGRGGFAIRGADAGGASGQSVSGAGDVDGDGLADLVIGVPFANPGGRYDAGKSYVVLGKKDGRAVELSDVLASRGGFAIVGSTVINQSILSVAGAGDVNGDGLADLILGVPNVSPDERPDLGESYVVFGKRTSAAVHLPDVAAGRGGFVIHGGEPIGFSGWSVSGAGDVNGDGLADVIIGAPFVGDGIAHPHYAGESYVVFGKSDGAAVELLDVQAGRGGLAMRGISANDSLGHSVSGAGDINGDGLADIIIGAHYADPEGREHAGESYVIFGRRDGGALSLWAVREGEGGFAIRGSADGDASRQSVSDAGDVNGDGLADLIIGLPFADPKGRDRAGESYVVFGKRSGAATDIADVREGRGGFAIRGIANWDVSGWSVSGAGDVNGDGLADVVVGAPEADVEVSFNAGESYVVFGKRDSVAVELSDILEGRGGFAIRGGRVGGDGSGWSVSGAGDVDGDGLADLLIGAPRGHSAGGQVLAGQSYVVFGKKDGTAVELSDVLEGRGGFAMLGIAEGDYSGWSVSGAGDVNGDGLADLLIGAPGADAQGRSYAGAGVSYLVFGKRDGVAVALADVQSGRGGFAMLGVADGDYAGTSVSGAGDVNGDGLADLLIGAYYASPRNRYYAGESYVVFGKRSGAVVELSAVVAGRGGFAIRGGAAYDYSGTSVSGIGDVNGDGLADLLVGAPGADPGGMDDAGESYVVFGKSDGATVQLTTVESGRGGFVIRGGAAYDFSGTTVSGAGDVNGDGIPDLAIGARLPEGRYPSISDLSGAAYVVFTGGGAESEPRFRRGAVRGEDSLSISDAIKLLEYLFLSGAQPSCLDAADADDTGRINVSDAVVILNYLFLSGDAPPTPGPSSCGEDPTADELGCEISTGGCER